MAQIMKPRQGVSQDNSFMGGLTKALPVIGAVGLGAAAGPLGLGAAGASAGATAAGGAGLGLGVGSALQGMLSKAPEQQMQQEQSSVGNDGAFARRMQSLKSSSDNNLQQLKQAALALPQLPPEVRTEAAHPIMTALISDAYGRPVKG
jgi:hypothetical protein